MAHDHLDAHAHANPATVSTGKMGLAVMLTLAFVAGESISGYFAHSLALATAAQKPPDGNPPYHGGDALNP